MSATYRKTANGSIEVAVINDHAPVFIGRAFRMIESFRVDIAQWFDASTLRSWFALRNPCLTMLDNLDDTELFKYDYDAGNETESRFVRYEGVVLLQSDGVNTSSEPGMYLTDLRGRLLAGSNIYNDSGRLCLGGQYNALNLSPVEMLMHNEANRDLGWRGSALEGEWIDGIFRIHKWPTINTYNPPPAAIIADIGRLWPT